MEKNKKIISMYIRTEEKNMKDVRKQEDELLSKFNTDDTLIYDIYIDCGYNGSCDKPAYQRLLNDMKQNKFDTIVAYSLDRFGRSYDALEYFIRQLTCCDCRLMTIVENIDIFSENNMLINKQ